MVWPLLPLLANLMYKVKLHIQLIHVEMDIYARGDRLGLLIHHAQLIPMQLWVLLPVVLVLQVNSVLQVPFLQVTVP